jgi:hypothetical protein
MLPVMDILFLVLGTSMKKYIGSMDKIPECAAWVLTTLDKNPKVLTDETRWPFPVSVLPSGETQVRVQAIFAPARPLPQDEALF